jgi:hypothetical protein
MASPITVLGLNVPVSKPLPYPREPIDGYGAGEYRSRCTGHRSEP